MSMIYIKHNTTPNLDRPSFTVDKPLNPKLDKYELTKLMNKHNFTLFLGKAGSGKSSLLISLLQTKSMFYGVYHQIFLFCPPNSRASISNDFWDVNLPEDQILDELNLENLQYVYDVAKDNRRKGLNTLVILDDVQKYLKGDCEKLLLEMNNNRRHEHLSIWMACQNYKSIPLQVRQGLTGLFCFKVNKSEMENLMHEQIEIDEKTFNKILNMTFKKPHDFIFIDTNSQRIFYNWDEIVYNK